MNANLTHREMAIFTIAVAALLGSGTMTAGSPSYDYHIRVVRVSGAGIDPGAALGWNSDDGTPVVLPGYEAWGTPEQLAGLADALGGESADAVTGFFLINSDGGPLRFERRVYVGGNVLNLSLLASPPAVPGDGHEFDLQVDLIDSPGDHLVEAKLEVQTDRTVAIACPLPGEVDWLVLAVTLLDRHYQQTFIKDKLEDVLIPGEDGVTNPTIITKTPPRYPESAKKSKLSGNVILQAIVDESGITRCPMVLRMTPGAEELAAAAVDAVLQWRYSPAVLHGNPVPVYLTINVAFRLE